MWKRRRTRKASAVPQQWEFRLRSSKSSPKAHTCVREGQSVTQCGGYIFVLGGHSSYAEFTPIQSAVLHVLKQKWVPLDLDVTETFHSACLVDDRIISVGGFDRFQHASDVFSNNLVTVYDITLGAYVYHQEALGLEAPPGIPNMCCRHIAEFFENKREIVIFGGRGVNDAFLDQFYALHVDSMQWRPLQSKGQSPGEQSSHSSCLQGERMFIFCNYEDPALSNIFVCDYSGTIPHWSCLKSRGMAPPGLYSAALNLVGNRLILFGGYIYGVTAESFYVYDIPSGIWSAVTYDVDQADEEFRFFATGEEVDFVGRHRGLYWNGKIRYYGGDLGKLDDICELKVGFLNV